MSGPLKFSISLFGLAPRGVYLAAIVTNYAGELLPHHFTHYLFAQAGIFSVALVVTRFYTGARTLSGSLPYGVRTFLFPCEKRLPGPLHCEAGNSIAKNVQRVETRMAVIRLETRLGSSVRLDKMRPLLVDISLEEGFDLVCSTTALDLACDEVGFLIRDSRDHLPDSQNGVHVHA